MLFLHDFHNFLDDLISITFFYLFRDTGNQMVPENLLVGAP